MSPQVIHIQPAAPAKPPEGRPCNGCGVCCLAEPCPLGVVLTGRRTGACAALRWIPAQAIYRCGAMTDPVSVVQARLPRWLTGLGPVLGNFLLRWAGRWVDAGAGCDCSLDTEKAADGSA